MGRTDAVAFTNALAAEWRRLGAAVTFEPGWETRSNGQAPNYEGAVVHHTGFGSSGTNPFPARSTLLNGRPDLRGPLCNSAGPWCPPDRPLVHVIAAHPANHAGASGGRSMGPLPVTGLFNGRVWGHEIDYGGNVPMAPGQYRAALIVARGVANVLGRSTEYVRAHAETSVTGKWDPGYATGKTIDMAAFRRDAATLTPQGDDMSYPQWTKEDRDFFLADLRDSVLIPTLKSLFPLIADSVWAKQLEMQGYPGKFLSTGDILSASDAITDETRARVDAVGAATASAVAAATRGGDPAVLATALKEALGEQLAADVAARLTVTAS